MIGMGQVEYRVSEQYQQLFMLPGKHSGKRSVTSFDYHRIPDPLPELRLGSPELLAIGADDQRRALPLFIQLFELLIYLFRLLARFQNLFSLLNRVRR